MYKSVYYLGAYDCDTYGAGSYNENQCLTESTGGPLSPTGEAVVLPLGIGVLLLVISVAVLAMRRRGKKTKRTKK